MKAMALDPGKTTGYAIAYLNSAQKCEIEVGEEEFSLAGLDDFLMGFVDGPNDGTHLIYEDFSYRNASRAGLDLTPVKMIGIIELYKERYEPFVSFTKQTAATGKAFWSDDKLKQRGVYAKGRKHGRDATRHLLQWMAFGAGSQYVNIDDISMTMEVA